MSWRVLFQIRISETFPRSNRFFLSTHASQSCLCGSASELPPDNPHSAATRPQSACDRSRRGPHVALSVPEAAFLHGEIQEAYLVSHTRALATAIIDRAQIADQACIRVTMTSFDRILSVEGR